MEGTPIIGVPSLYGFLVEQFSNPWYHNFTMELVPTITLIFGSSFLTAIVTAWFNRRKTSAEANSVIVATALEVVKNTVGPLNDRIKQLEEQSMRQAEAIENTNAEVLKTQLAYIILKAQLEALGYDPVIKSDDLTNISVEELRRIAREVKDKN